MGAGADLTFTTAAVPPVVATGSASEIISGLQVGATYHCRLTASNSSGTTSGADLTFMTEALPHPALATWLLA